MPFRSRILPAVLTFFLLCLPATGSCQVPVRLASADEIHDMLVNFVDVQHKSDGVVVEVLTRRAREVISYGHFDPDDARVPTADTVFEIGSISKVFTALLLSDMAVKGELKLSDPISQYLPASVHVPTYKGKPITLLDLATHYSGLPRDPNNFNSSLNYSTGKLYEFVDRYQLQRAPGEKYEYSNLGYGLLGAILANKAGSDYETLLRTRITGPLGMQSTAIQLTPEMKADFTPGHGTTLGKVQPWIIPGLSPAGGIRSTAGDLTIFLAANMGIIKSPLQPAMKKMLSVKRDVSAGTKVALGWHITPGSSEIVYHNGETTGYYSFMGYDPRRKIGVVVLSNSNNRTDDIFWRIFNHPMSRRLEESSSPPNLPQ